MELTRSPFTFIRETFWLLWTSEMLICMYPSSSVSTFAEVWYRVFATSLWPCHLASLWHLVCSSKCRLLCWPCCTPVESPHSGDLLREQGLCWTTYTIPDWPNVTGIWVDPEPSNTVAWVYLLLQLSGTGPGHISDQSVPQQKRSDSLLLHGSLWANGSILQTVPIDQFHSRPLQCNIMFCHRGANRIVSSVLLYYKTEA